MTKSNLFKALFVTIVVIILVVFGFIALLRSMPFTYGEIDINKNGFLSIQEIEYVTSYGNRKVMHKGKECLEYYALKDGLPIKIVCM